MSTHKIFVNTENGDITLSKQKIQRIIRDIHPHLAGRQAQARSITSNYILLATNNRTILTLKIRHIKTVQKIY